MLEFVRRHRILLTSGCLLLGSLLLVSVSARTPRSRDLVARLLLDGLEPMQSAVTWTGNLVFDTWDGYVNLVNVRSENQALRERVTDLQRQVIRLGELERSAERLEALLEFRSTLEGPVHGARVIGRDPLPSSRTFTIDRGELDGLHRGMAVISPQGAVGQIMEVGRSAGRVLLLTDHNSGIDAIVQRSRARGIVQGAVEQGCHMKYLRRGEDVTVGDQVVTSGLDGIFPKGILIGEVVDVSPLQRGLLQVAVVRPVVSLDRIEEVLVVDPTAHLREETP